MAVITIHPHFADKQTVAKRNLPPGQGSQVLRPRTFRCRSPLISLTENYDQVFARDREWSHGWPDVLECSEKLRAGAGMVPSGARGPGGVPTWLMEQLWEKPGVVRRTTSPADS